MGKFKLTYKSFGDSAILMEWPQIISKTVLSEIRQFAEELENKKHKGIVEISFIYSSLLVSYDVNKCSSEKLMPFLKSLYKSEIFSLNNHKIIWEIPVCYDIDFGIDLALLTSKKKLSVKEIISLHTSQNYTVYGIGFLPGFLYLGGLSEKLKYPRKSTPRLSVPKGAVAIGGSQTGIYPQNSPGGWHIIGRTPVSLFDVKKEIPCMINPGDEIKFNSISIEEFNDVIKDQNAGNYELKKSTND